MVTEYKPAEVVKELSEKVENLCQKFPELCESIDGLKDEVQKLQEAVPKALTEEHIPAIQHSVFEHIGECPACRAGLGLYNETEASAKFGAKEPAPKSEPVKEEKKAELVVKPKVKALRREELPASFSAYGVYGLEPEKQPDGTYIIRDKGRFAEIWGEKGERASIKFMPSGCSLKCEDPSNPQSCKVVCED